MVSYSLSVLFLYGSLLAVQAASTPVSPPSHRKRDPPPTANNSPLENITTLSANSIDRLSELSPNLAVISDAIASRQVGPSVVVSAYRSVFKAIKPAPAPLAIEDVQALVQREYTNPSPYLIDSAASLLLQGLDPSNVNSPTAKRDGTDIDSTNNVNSRNPATTIYPTSSSTDPDYSVSEQQLRSAIHIPSTFDFGSNSKQAVILVPGTGIPGGTTYAHNFAKLLAGTTFADPLWLNIPGFTLGDAQVSAEYVAYAIHYISGITGGKNVSVVTWSQGSLDTQWALKYWPSTRELVSDHIAISGDYHGTVLAYALCPGFPGNLLLGCTPSILQQTYNSNFVQKLRSRGGDSAYVPTTTVYSISDEIVQPQSNPTASSYLNDARGVGVTNNQVQDICAGSLAGGFYGHAAVLYNPLSWALTVDALQNPGPGQISRLNLPTVCRTVAASGLTLSDVVATEGMTVVGATNAVTYLPRVITEPALKPYVV